MRLLSKQELPARLEGLERAREVVVRCAHGCGISAEKGADIELTVQELLANVVRYAYPGKTGVVTVSCRANDDEFVVEITDQGIPFDPLSAPAPDLRAGLSERSSGGLGVFLVKQLADGLAYRREGNANIVTLTVSCHGTRAPELTEDQQSMGVSHGTD